MSGDATAGLALATDLTLHDGRVSGSAEYALGADSSGAFLLPVGADVVVVDAAADGG